MCLTQTFEYSTGGQTERVPARKRTGSEPVHICSERANRCAGRPLGRALRERYFSLVCAKLGMTLFVSLLPSRSKVGIEKPPPVAFCWSRFWRVPLPCPVTCTGTRFEPSSSSRSTSAVCSRKGASTSLTVRDTPLWGPCLPE